jgi:hypothetical protein
MAGDMHRSGGQWRATGGAPAGGSTPPGAAHLPRAAAGTGELPPAQRSDQRSLRRLGVCARRGYGAYGGLPTWSCTTSRQSASRRSKVFVIR